MTHINLNKAVPHDEAVLYDCYKSPCGRVGELVHINPDKTFILVMPFGYEPWIVNELFPLTKPTGI